MISEAGIEQIAQIFWDLFKSHEDPNQDLTEIFYNPERAQFSYLDDCDHNQLLTEEMATEVVKACISKSIENNKAIYLYDCKDNYLTSFDDPNPDYETDITEEFDLDQTIEGIPIYRGLD